MINCFINLDQIVGVRRSQQHLVVRRQIESQVGYVKAGLGYDVLVVGLPHLDLQHTLLPRIYELIIEVKVKQCINPERLVKLDNVRI